MNKAIFTIIIIFSGILTIALVGMMPGYWIDKAGLLYENTNIEDFNNTALLLSSKNIISIIECFYTTFPTIIIFIVSILIFNKKIAMLINYIFSIFIFLHYYHVIINYHANIIPQITSIIVFLSAQTMAVIIYEKHT